MKTKTKKQQIKPQESESHEVDHVTRDDTPAADWTVERLAAYARGRMAEADESKKAKSHEELKVFDSIREALVHYEIEKPRQPATPTKLPADPPQKRDAEVDVNDGHEDEELDEATAPKDEKQPPAPSQDPGVPCVPGKLQVERKGKKTTFKLEDVEVRMNRVPPCKFDVRIVGRWRADLRLALDGGEAVLIIPGLEVPDVAAG